MDIVALSRDSVGLMHHYIFMFRLFSRPQVRDVGHAQSYAFFVVSCFVSI